MCNKAVANYPLALEFVSEGYKTQNIYDKAVDTHLTTIRFFPGYYKTK